MCLHLMRPKNLLFLKKAPELDQIAENKLDLGLRSSLSFRMSSSTNNFSMQEYSDKGAARNVSIQSESDNKPSYSPWDRNGNSSLDSVDLDSVFLHSVGPNQTTETFTRRQESTNSSSASQSPNTFKVFLGQNFWHSSREDVRRLSGAIENPLANSSGKA